SQKVYFLDVADHDAPVQESALNRLYIEDVLKLVEKLPVATRDVFMLYAIEGLSHAEIAARVNISEGTSKWHLATARKKLKQWINMDFNQSNYAG
ncbi:MAG: RNA polymerase sigma factor, partial [Saprospiraceae bacterium]|nr:RNA polymerase sigma factor [Saprospiraceae bacterium]